MKITFTLVIVVAAVLLAGCGEAGNQTVEARQADVITRWKYHPQSIVGTPKGIILEQAGDRVEASFVYLKDGDGFVVDRKISQGKYYPAKKLLVLPPGPVTSDEVDQLVQMNVPRVEIAFTPDQPVLKGRWLGQGSPEFNMDFVRVQE